MKLKVTVDGKVYDVDVEVEEEPIPALGAIVIGGASGAASPTGAAAPAPSGNALTAPLAGTVVKVLVEAGAAVTAGQTVMVLEAMKMETEITAPSDAEVAAVQVAVGDAVAGGQVLLDWA